MQNYSKYTDQQLVNMVVKNKRDSNKAFLELYNRYSKSVYTYSLLKFYNSQKAKEIFEQAFTDFYITIKSGRLIENIRAYLFGIVKFKLINEIRDNKKNISLGIIDSDINSLIGSDIHFNSGYMNTIDMERDMENRELIRLIEAAVELLNDDEKEYYKLNKFGGLSASEIAETFNENINSVKSKIYRAQLKVKETLAPYINELNSFQNRNYE